jgi:DNA-binding beta-propeller fold protein YncE
VPDIVDRSFSLDHCRILTEAGLDPVLARVLAARGIIGTVQLDTRLAHLAAPTQMHNLQRLGAILADAIAAQKRLLIVADYDSDGATGCAVGLLALREMGAQVDYIVPNRFEFGYGLTPEIVRLAADGRVSDFAKTGAFGLQDVLGMKVDVGRRLLWACTAASPRAGAAAGSSALFQYDLTTARLVKAYWVKNTDGKHLLNDVALTTSGDVFVTDSDASLVWRLAKGGDALEVFVGPGTFIYPNGIALAPDEKRLYVADFKHGLAVVDLSTKATRPLPHPASVSTAGIDGLYAVASDLVAVQNGAGRERVVRYWLDPEGEHIQKLEVMESRNPFFRLPTTGVVTSEGFVYLANPNLEALDDDGNLRKDAHLEDVVLLRAPLH